MRLRTTGLIISTYLGLAVVSGCAVPQPRGEGLYTRVTEPQTGAAYHLYLPVDYVRNNGRHPDYPRVQRWPLVMTFHGMKPYDNALPQEREWEQEADFYGYIVCAPELHSSDSFMEYPLTKEHSYVLKDRECVMAIMDHIFLTTRADPKRVLSTSWSSGGYLAHYFPNRFPNRFSCIATRLSNFSAKLMIETTVPLYKNRVPVAIFVGDSDLPATKSESEEAVAWYMARNFRVVRGKMIDGMGHSRIPQTAAAFFAEQMGFKPLHAVDAAKTVSQVQMTEYYPSQELIARMSPPPQLGPVLVRGDTSPPSAAAAVAQPRLAAVPKPRVSYLNNNAGRNYPFDQRPEYKSLPEKQKAASRQKSRPSVPPTGAGATRVASAQPKSGNWLEPVDRSERSASPRKVSPRGSLPGRSKPKISPPDPQSSKLAVKDRKRPTPPKARPASGGSQTRRSAREDHKASPRASLARSFTPTDAGSRDHDLWQRADSRRGNDTPSASPQAHRSAREASGARTTNAGRSLASPRRRGRAKRVNIMFKGPAIGTSPHYLAYSANLSPELLVGGDFLWKDNGVWMGDEASGVKILESPGLHRITVLLVTRDNKEYRGMATVQVLQAGPASTRTALAPH